MSGAPLNSINQTDLLRREARIIGAVLLQDMRTRFGRSYLGYLIAVAWPLCHVLVILGVRSLVGTVTPTGDDPAVFFGTGLLLYVLCLYPARQLGYTLAQNRQLLNIPILRPMHLMVARLILELLTASVVCMLFYVILAALGTDITPNDLSVAVAAIGATLYLALGLGILNVVLVAIFGSFALVGFTLIMVGLYLTSGIMVPLWMVPEPFHSYMLYNPLCILVEWLRSAYYVSREPISKDYVIAAASISLLLGLLGERFMRNKLLS